MERAPFDAGADDPSPMCAARPARFVRCPIGSASDRGLPLGNLGGGWPGFCEIAIDRTPGSVVFPLFRGLARLEPHIGAGDGSRRAEVAAKYFQTSDGVSVSKHAWMGVACAPAARLGASTEGRSGGRGAHDAKRRGTRSRANQLHIEPAATSMTRSYTRDVGVSKLATASMTFGSGEVSAANGTFASFVAGDLVAGAGRRGQPQQRLLHRDGDRRNEPFFLDALAAAEVGGTPDGDGEDRLRATARLSRAAPLVLGAALCAGCAAAQPVAAAGGSESPLQRMTPASSPVSGLEVVIVDAEAALQREARRPLHAALLCMVGTRAKGGRPRRGAGRPGAPRRRRPQSRGLRNWRVHGRRGRCGAILAPASEDGLRVPRIRRGSRRP